MKYTPIAEGETVPYFKTTDEKGKTFSSADLMGKKYLLYFYPRDNTPGCIIQACGIKDEMNEFSKKNIIVLGVSGGSFKSHQKFKEKYTLSFPLLMDQDHALAKSFGVWGEKKFMGRTFDGIHRTSFLIGENGLVLKTFLKVKPKLHTSLILEYIQSR